MLPGLIASAVAASQARQRESARSDAERAQYSTECGACRVMLHRERQARRARGVDVHQRRVADGRRIVRGLAPLSVTVARVHAGRRRRGEVDGVVVVMRRAGPLAGAVGAVGGGSGGTWFAMAMMTTVSVVMMVMLGGRRPCGPAVLMAGGRRAAHRHVDVRRGGAVLVRRLIGVHMRNGSQVTGSVSQQQEYADAAPDHEFLVAVSLARLSRSCNLTTAFAQCLGHRLDGPAEVRLFFVVLPFLMMPDSIVPDARTLFQRLASEHWPWTLLKE